MRTKVNQTNKRLLRLGRRAFLGGGAAAIGLPWLDSLRSARAQTETPIRLLYWFLPNGLDMDTFRPASTGAGYTVPTLLQPLAALQDDFLVVTGLDNEPARPVDLGHHAAGTAAFLTATAANKSLTDIRLGISVDQIAANEIGTGTRIPSMQLGLEGGSRAGDCDSGYACDYARNISWADETTPLPKLTDPVAVFNQIFEGFDEDANDAEIARRQERKASVLDLVTQDANDLMGQLGYTDQQKLEQYLTGVRELEKRITTTATLTCTPGESPLGERGLEYPDHYRAMLDLMVMAYQCDATRVISFMQGNALSGRTYPHLGISRGHHDISHHGRDAANIEMLVQIGTWEFEQVAYLFDRLKQIPDGPDGSSTLLSNSVIMISSDISDGDFHNNDDKPVIIGGQGGGFFRAGEHIEYPGGFGQDHEKFSNMLVTTLAAAGVQSALGDSDKALLEELIL